MLAMKAARIAARTKKARENAQGSVTFSAMGTATDDRPVATAVTDCRRNDGCPGASRSDT